MKNPVAHAAANGMTSVARVAAALLTLPALGTIAAATHPELGNTKSDLKMHHDRLQHAYASRSAQN
jgi:hypothetical protein